MKNEEKRELLEKFAASVNDYNGELVVYAFNIDNFINTLPKDKELLFLMPNDEEIKKAASLPNEENFWVDYASFKKGVQWALCEYNNLSTSPEEKEEPGSPFDEPNRFNPDTTDEKERIVANFVDKLVSGQKDIDPEFAEIVNKHWKELLY